MQSGSLLKRYSISLVTAVALVTMCAFISQAADTPAPKPMSVRMLPATNDVKGWEVYANTLVYVRGEKLTEIYDGGYELYTKNGVLDAAQQMYRRKNDIVTVTVHEMASMDSAKKFYEYWQKDDAKQSTYKKLNILTEAYVYTANGTANGYLYRNKYFVTVQVNIEGAAGRTAADQFLKNVSAKYWKLVTPTLPKKK